MNWIMDSNLIWSHVTPERLSSVFGEGSEPTATKDNTEARLKSTLEKRNSCVQVSVEDVCTNHLDEESGFKNECNLYFNH
jgi:hypothetical protein